MSIFAQLTRATIGGMAVIGLHAALVWQIVTNESKAKPPVQPPKPIQVSLIAAAPPAAVENKTKSMAALSAPALPIRPKVDAPPPKPKAKPKRKPKPKLKAKPKPIPKPKAIPKPPKPQPVRTARSQQSTTVASRPSSVKSTSNTGSNTGANKPSTSRPSGSSSGTARSTAAKVTKPIFRAGYLNNPPPEYPRASKRRGEEGKVLLKVRVSAQGKPIKIQLHRSSGFKKLDKAAQKTVKRWRFVPAKQGNTPIAAWVIVPIEFNLR